MTGSGSTSIRLRAMATGIRLSVAGTGESVSAALERARAVFEEVQAACTRFDPGSPLMLANADPGQWHEMPWWCFEAIREASRAHRETGGLFDPRVLGTLLALGYDRSLPFADGPVVVRTRSGPGHPSAIPVRTALRPLPDRPWQPDLDATRRAVRLGADPIDLGGIGKGLAVRWAAAELAATGLPYLIEAGGDCSFGGNGPEAQGWLVGVEDPARRAPERPAELAAVLRLADASCATSSVRIRTWQVDGHDVHHLIDPRTGESSRGGLSAVTVVHPDPAWAEVWSKSLLLLGRDGIRAGCDRHGLAALWITDDGLMDASPAIRDQLVWEACCAI